MCNRVKRQHWSCCISGLVHRSPDVNTVFFVLLQGRSSGLAERAGRTVWALLSEVSGAKQSWTEQRREGTGNQPQGERHGATEEREPGGSAAVDSAGKNDAFTLKTPTKYVYADFYKQTAITWNHTGQIFSFLGLKGPFDRGDETNTICHQRSRLRGQKQDALRARGNNSLMYTWNWKHTRHFCIC